MNLFVLVCTIILCSRHLQKVSWCQISPTELLKIDCARPTLPWTFIPGHRSRGPGDSLESWAVLSPGDLHNQFWKPAAAVSRVEALETSARRQGTGLCRLWWWWTQATDISKLATKASSQWQPSPAQPCHLLVVSQLIARLKHTAAVFVCWVLIVEGLVPG